MSDGHDPLRPEQESRKSRRPRDFMVLTLSGVVVLGLMTLSTSAGAVEWVLGAAVLISGALAYYVGSQSLTPPRETLNDLTGAQRLPTPLSDSGLTPLIQSLPFPALIINPDQRLSIANARAMDVFRLSRDTGLLITAAIRQPDLLTAFIRVAKTGAREQLEFSAYDEGQSWMAHMHAGPKAGSVLMILEDTTAVRRAEQARADFLANASHELRTPLTAIAGFIETMRGPAREDKDSWDGFLEIMFQQSERMKRLVADLLSLSRIEFSEHRSPSTQLDLTVLVSGTGLSLQPIAAETGIRILLNQTDTSHFVVADADEMQQVVQNLAGNAIKYSPSGGTVTLSMGQSRTMAEAPGDCGRQIEGASRATLLVPRASAEVPAVWIRVEDHGEGIPARHLPRLGERFYRVDESRGGSIEGTGLGLAIVKHIMARHRGGFMVESLEGTGTAFAVWMPRFQVPLTQ